MFLLVVEKYEAISIAPLGRGGALMTGELAGMFFSGGRSVVPLPLSYGNFDALLSDPRFTQSRPRLVR